MEMATGFDKVLTKAVRIPEKIIAKVALSALCALQYLKEKKVNFKVMVKLFFSILISIINFY